MKIKHIWSVLCQDSTLNQDDNIISLNKVLEELSITVTPPTNEENKPLPEKINLPLNYEIVSLWDRESKEGKVEALVEVSFVSPDGEELLKPKIINLTMPENIRRCRSRIKVSGIVVKKSGDYIFKIKIKEENGDKFRLVSEIPLEVKIEIQKPTVKN